MTFWEIYVLVIAVAFFMGYMVFKRTISDVDQVPRWSRRNELQIDPNYKRNEDLITFDYREKNDNTLYNANDHSYHHAIHDSYDKQQGQETDIILF